MSLDVGELVARLTVDDTRFTRSLQQGEQRLQNLGTTARTEAGRVDQALQNAGQGANRLGQNAQDAARDLGRVGDTSRDISRVETTARGAATGVQEIGTNARRAAGQVDEIGSAARRAGQQVGQLGNDLDDAATGAGQAGSRTGGNFLSGFSDAIGGMASKTGPIAGSILGIAALGLGVGAALAAAIQDGMQQELNRDIFQAQTGTTEAQARKFATAAGEVFANAFGESVEANLSTAKIALQYGFVDAGSTQREIEKATESLQGVSDIVGTEAQEVARGAGALVNSGLATSFDEAMDFIVASSQKGIDRQGDLIDSLSEYSAGWKNSGLSAQTTMALIKQSMDLGVDNADRGADAIREFGRRVSEEGDTIVETLDGIGLDGAAMFDDFKAGGDQAEEAFDKAFDAIRQIEDPTERNQAAMALLGDTAGDFIGAFTQWDPSEAKKKFGEVEGAAASAIGVMGNNAATSVQGAINSITVVADGLKGALAEAFGPYIKNFADDISNNRAGVIQFAIDVGNAFFEGGKAVLGFVEGGMRGLASFTQAGTDLSVSFLRSLADMTEGISGISSVLSLVIPGFGSAFGGLGDISGKLNAMADAAESGGNAVADGMNKGADGIRDTLIPALDAGQAKFNEVANKMKESAAFNDASAKLTAAISDVGVGADGNSIKIDNWTGAIDRNNAAQVQMEQGVVSLKDKLTEQIKTGLQAGTTVEGLTAQYGENRGALIDQLMATGMSNKAAVDYINTLGLTPGLVETLIKQPGMPEAHYALDVLKGKVIDVPDSKTVHTEALTKDAEDNLIALGYKVEHLPDGTVKVTAPTDEAEAGLQALILKERHITLGVRLSTQSAAELDAQAQALANQLSTGSGPDYGRVHYADGGFNQLPDWATIMSPRANLVQWAEPETGGEAFIPLAMSKRARSEDILAEVARRFGMKLVDEETAKIFRGDPKSLTDETDPTGWRALLGGEYNGKLRKLGIEEDHPLVNAVLGARSVINDGAFDERLRIGTGMEEDHPLVNALMGFHQFNAQENRKLALADLSKRMGFGMMSFADGGIVDSLTGVAQSKFPALQVTDTYRPGASDYHGAGQAVDFSNGSGNTDDQLAFANYMADNYKSKLAELIYIDPRFGRCIKDGEFVPDSFYAGAGDHTNHVHVAAKEALGEPGGQAGAGTGSDTRTEKQKMADAIVAEGRRRGISDNGIKAALAAGLAETDLQNLDHGMDGDNAGILQQRDNGAWGTLEDRKDPTKAVGMFYDKLDDFDYDSMDPADAAQKVQQSGTADGSNYRAELAEATELYRDSDARLKQGTVSGTTDSGVSMSTDGQRVFVTNWPGSYDTSTSTTAPAPTTTTPAPPPAEAKSETIWSAGIKIRANGGIDGLPDQAGIQRGTVYQYGEPETGGEAFIPLGSSKRPRSLSLTRQVANRFGYELVPMADGGLGGFGGYTGHNDKPTLDIPLTPGGWAKMSANQRRAAMYNLGAIGVGGAFTVASGFDENGQFTGDFDMGANSHPALEKGFEQLATILEEIRKAAEEGKTVNVKVDVDQSGNANLAITKMGL